MKNTNFIAIDFETATNKRMACQIGLVVVIDGVITKRITTYIQPPGNIYDPATIRVHKITPEVTKESEAFDVVWEEISHYFIGTTIVAHNAQFDEDVLYKNLSHYGILPLGINPFKCTCNLFGRTSLHDLCEGFDMDTSGHHDALFDAECCAKFYLKYLNGEKPKAIKKKTKRKRSEQLSGDILIKDLSNADPNNPLYDRKVAITGEFTMERKALALKLKSLGADITTSISKKTNYVLIGEYPGPVKIEKLDKLIFDGFNIRKMYQKDIDAIFAGDWEGYHADKEIAKELDFTLDHYNQNHLLFEDGRNVIASKELYLGKGFRGNMDLFCQITGNLGACGDYDIYPETNLCVLSDSTLEKLKNGDKDETILYIQNLYNRNKSKTFNFQFIAENEILRFCKNRCDAIGDLATLYLFNKYMNSVSKLM